MTQHNTTETEKAEFIRIHQDVMKTVVSEIPDYMDELSETYRLLMEPATHRTIPDNRTTEEKNAGYRENLTLYDASKTIRRLGWYYTEVCLPEQYPIEV